MKKILTTILGLTVSTVSLSAETFEISNSLYATEDTSNYLEIVLLDQSSVTPATFQSNTKLQLLETNVASGLFTGNADLSTDKISSDPSGSVHVRMSAAANNIKIIGGTVIVHIDKDGTIINITGHKFTNIPAPTPTISDNNLLDYIEGSIVPEGSEIISQDLVYYVSQKNEIFLAYALETIDPGTRAHLMCYIDAHTGDIVGLDSYIHYALDREIRNMDGHAYIQDKYNYSSNSGWSYDGYYLYPGNMTRNEDDPETGNTIVDNAYHYFGEVYNFFSVNYGLDSFDNNGISIIANVNAGDNVDSSLADVVLGDDRFNAFYFPTENTFTFGIGGDSYNNFLARDVLYHEYTHAITEHQVSGGLEYASESGALNEAYSDIFAAIIESDISGQIDGNTWLIGEDVFTNSAFRDMADPEDFDQPDNYEDLMYKGVIPTYYNDYGGVHYNSGIVNHAFYLSVVGGTHVNQYKSTQVAPISMNTAHNIYFYSYDRLTANSNFDDAATALAETAYELYGLEEARSIIQAWYAVGVIESMWGTSGDEWRTTYLGKAYFYNETNDVWLQSYQTYVRFDPNYDEDSGGLYLWSYNEGKWVWTNSTYFPWYWDYSTASWNKLEEGNSFN